jgi:hypothetical protein
LPSNHPSTGGIWIIWKKSDGSDASIGLTFFDDLTDVHHQVELWWRYFKGNEGCTKDVCGHQMNPKEDVEVFITMTSSVFVIPRLKNEVT